MFTYEQKYTAQFKVSRPDFKYYLLLDRELNGTRDGIESAARYIRQSFYLNNKEFRNCFMQIATRELNDMEILSDIIHQMHGQDDRYYDEDNDDTPVYELIRPLDEEKPNTEHPRMCSDINNDISAAVMYDLKCEHQQYAVYEELYKKIQDEGTREAIHYLMDSKSTVIDELKGILNTLTVPNEIKDFGLGDSHNAWDLCGGNYFDKPNPIFTNPDELETLETKKHEQ